MRLLALAVALGGCMKIYPSGELPDLDVEWYVEDCSLTPEISVTLVGLDDGSVSERIFPCEDFRATIDDVDRVLYRVDGFLLAPGGDIALTSSQEADLRNGIDEEVYLYFQEDPYVRVSWQFADGESCESLDVDTIDIDVLEPDFGPYTMSTSCGQGVFSGYLYGNSLSVQVRAVSRRNTVAVSERSEPFEVSPPDVTNVGPLTLVACGTDCPD